MSLKQSIVIVNEYTIKTSKGGTRGGSPGKYIVNYMARTGAVENSTPGIDLLPDNGVMKDDYFPGYMVRPDAVEQADDLPEYKRRVRTHELDGVAFGDGDLSLSYNSLKKKSRAIQDAFDNGKTVLKTVISFDEEFLRDSGIIDETFACEREGDYRGNIDQMKLRGAITAGVQKLSYGYDDLRYVGTIQVDTKHVHCHLAMCDFGKGTLGSDGRQKGKINAKGLSNIRRGIDGYLDEYQTVKSLASNVTHDRRNALCYVKNFTHKSINLNGTPQFLLACLPSDKRKWRAGTNAKDMRKANEVTREYVERLFDEPDSGYDDAMRDISAYVDERHKREGLTDKAHRSLLSDMRERLVDDCINGVYAVLKKIPDERREVDTSMMAMMAADFDDLKEHDGSDPMVEFAYHLRSYSTRLNYHKKESHKWSDAVDAYKSNPSATVVSSPLLDFYEVEAEYNKKAMCKYQHFLGFLPPVDEYQDDFKYLMDYKAKMRNLELMVDDPSPRRMKPDAAEDYGKRVYGQHGGRFVVDDRDILERRLELMGATYNRKESAFKDKLADYGLSLDENGVSTKKPYAFDDVKSIDLHHLGYDFAYDADVSRTNADVFVNMANKRYNAFQNAKNYLVLSGQEFALQQFPEKDIVLMKNMADSMSDNSTIKSTDNRSSGGSTIRRAKTVKLDRSHCVDMEIAVKATIQATQLGN